MHLSAILFLATTAAAWTVPANQPNGLYSVWTNNFNEPTHTPIALTTMPNSFTKPTTLRAKFPKRQNIGSNNIGCGDYSLSSTDNAAAIRALKEQCGKGAFVGEGRDFYSIVGDSVVYFCNFSDETNQCFASEAEDAFGRISSQCGVDNAGWDIVRARNDQYGYERVGSDFCGRGV